MLLHLRNHIYIMLGCTPIFLLLPISALALQCTIMHRMKTVALNMVPAWDQLQTVSSNTAESRTQEQQNNLRRVGEGDPHTDALLRSFGSDKSPDVIFYRDNAGWCPYCQKVWILLEEKRIPYRVEKINMRSYGDKPAQFLLKVPNGLLPAIEINGKLQTESFEIMQKLDHIYKGAQHVTMWPDVSNIIEQTRAKYLMNLERRLFSAWCGLVFRPSTGPQGRRLFEQCLDEVDYELNAEEGPWLLSYLSIVDLTYISHIERMCASVPYWAGFSRCAVMVDGRLLNDGLMHSSSARLTWQPNQTITPTLRTFLHSMDQRTLRRAVKQWQQPLTVLTGAGTCPCHRLLQVIWNR